MAIFVKILAKFRFSRPETNNFREKVVTLQQNYLKMALTKDSLNTAFDVTASFVESIPKKVRKKYGQFFTSRKTAEFMASLFTINFSKPELRLLDAK